MNEPAQKRDKAAALERLVTIMARLRDPERGCPWDTTQTLESIRQYLIEETFEVLEAIEEGTPEQHKVELGDLLFQIALQARIQEEAGHFDIGDVADAISDKMVRRHPHIFGDAEAQARGPQMTWGRIKAREGRDSAIDGIPRAMPALLRARRIGEKAAGVGFDWGSIDGVFEKLDEERDELKEALAEGDAKAVEHEMGDYLFTLVNMCRHMGIDPEAALRSTTNRFERRFRLMENQIKADGLAVHDLDLDTLEARWQAAKAKLRSEGRY